MSDSPQHGPPVPKRSTSERLAAYDALSLREKLERYVDAWANPITNKNRISTPDHIKSARASTLIDFLKLHFQELGELIHVVNSEHTGTLQVDSIPGWLRHSEAYQAISDFYGLRTAKRSGVPLMKHIHEGLVILDRIGASPDAMKAYCLHPLFQTDGELLNIGSEIVEKFTPKQIMLALEYRNIANQFLSPKVVLSTEISTWSHEQASIESDIVLSPLPEVNDMLIADKVQNRKDFEKYHKGNHPESNRLVVYFGLWCARLGITETRYLELIKDLDLDTAA